MITDNPPHARAQRDASRPGRGRIPADLAERRTAVDLLQLIWKESRISRAEISRRTGLSRSTVSAVVSDLISAGLVAEIGAGPSRGGRRPIELQFQYDADGLLGVDLGASHVAVALTNLHGEVRAFSERSWPVREDPQGALSLMAELCEEVLPRWPGGSPRMVGIGVGVPSPVDPRQPDRLSDTVVPAWRGVSVTSDLRDRYGLPLLLDNDANLGALAEHWWGASRAVDDSVFIKVATGIGAGHIIGGRIYRGATGTAGEIGHMAIDSHGPRCVCGLSGCLVTYVGTEALLRRARELLAAGRDSQLPRRKLTITQLENAVLAGDPVALEVVREAADHLGTAVAGLLNLVNPAVVTIGGSLARLGELLLEPVRQSVRARTLVTSVAAARIVASELGPRDVAVGAATLVLQAALEDLSYFPAPTPPA